MGKQTSRSHRGYKPQSRRRRRKVRWGRLIVSLLVFAAIIALIVLIASMIFGGKETPVPTPIATPVPTPTPTLAASLDVTMRPENDPDNFGFDTDIMISGEQVSSFTRETPISFGHGDEYTELPGIITFAGSNYRRGFTYGTQNLSQVSLSRVWEINTSAIDGWTGTGWTGMPVIVQWPADVRQVLGIHDKFKSMDGFTEVIYAAMDGYIYFMELYTGEKTRDPIKTGVTTKGTASLDPRGYPLLYTGQGLESTESDGNTGAWFRVIDLINNKVIWKFGGVDPFSHRGWQAYDSSALIDAETDTLIAPGENGVVYTVKLNTKFDLAAGTVSVNPDGLQKYRYTGDGYSGKSDQSDKRWVGIENSVAAWRNYLFFTDSGGRFQCLDINTFDLKYVVDVTDDSDTTSVIEEDVENQTFYIYTANEVDKQPGAVSAGYGKSYHRKINGLTGEIIWEKDWKASVGNTSSNGGTLSTPHVGREGSNIEDLVIYNGTLVEVTVDGETLYGGRIVAYNKHDGSVQWTYEQRSGYWSSPVMLYDQNNRAYLVQCDRGGMIRIHDPADGGKVLFEMNAGSRIESTPAVFGNMLVVGTRGTHGTESQKILGFKIN
ncbi:MAG: pyrrolo-quinoline quinone [Clostridia bacterium]|nr:pyrrolo-quinoline quinone [Clostridia bacterium]